ncbi:MAG TPA: LLM class flavin-dependent oxidoreductase [Candidatus Dormibacteraeota bacterium]
MSEVHPWVSSHLEKPGFGLTITGGGDWPALRETVQAYEELGFDSVWMPDHPLLGWDSWTLLAGLAEATSRIRLGTMVTCVYYRNPVQLARVVADVDRISGGRVVLGIGSGDMPWEFEQMGLAYPPPAERAVALERALQVVPALLRGEAVGGAQLRPPAAQQPHVPILVAGGGAKTTLPLAARFADANNMAAASWAGGAFTPEDARRKLETLDRLLAEAGRPREAVLRTTQAGFVLADSPEQAAAMQEAVRSDPVRARIMDFLEKIPSYCTPAEAVERVRSLQAAGYQYFVLPGADMRNVRRLVDEVIAPLRELASSPG